MPCMIGCRCTSLLDGGYRNIHRAFTEFTEYAATISPANAVEVIDHALAAAFRSRRPVRLELPSDLTHGRSPFQKRSSTSAILPPYQRNSGMLQRRWREAAPLTAPTAALRPAAARWNAVGTIQHSARRWTSPFGCTVPAVHQLGRPSTQFLGILPSVDVERQGHL